MKTVPDDSQFESVRPSGIPRPGRLGESKKELWALLGGIAVVVAIILAFWLEATP